MTEKKYTEQECHKKFAIELFNFVWTLLDKEERTKEDEDAMVHAAHASRYHWGQIGTPLEFERGEWQISRVYSVLGRPQPALYHAQRCLELCTENNIGDFDIAFAYEAVARANAAAGEQTEYQKYAKLAGESGEHIKGGENKKYFFSELESIPGYQQLL
jgi:hypothetical protein